MHTQIIKWLFWRENPVLNVGICDFWNAFQIVIKFDVQQNQKRLKNSPYTTRILKLKYIFIDFAAPNPILKCTFIMILIINKRMDICNLYISRYDHRAGVCLCRGDKLAAVKRSIRQINMNILLSIALQDTILFLC